MSASYDEEGLLKMIRAFEISTQITKLNWNWENYSDPVRVAHQLIIKGQNLLLEITEYGQSMGSRLGQHQKKEIEMAVDNLAKLILYIKNKINAPIALDDGNLHLE